jgi:hypothetical protein
LLALFAFSRRFVPGWWSVLPVAIAAVSQPFTAHTRTTYTEPLAATLILGGLALLVPAVQRASPGRLAVAGFVTGAACLTRPDCYFGVIGVVVAGAIAARRARAPGERWRLLLAPSLGWAVPAFIGTVDLYVLSRVYFNALRGEIAAQLAVGVLLLVAAAVAVALPWRATDPEVAASRRRMLGIGAGVAVVAAAIFFASRPLWHEQHGRRNVAFGGLQKGLLGIEEPTRTYGENTVRWMAWYFGWPTVLAGVIGIALLVAITLRKPRLEWAGPLAVVLADAALYLWRPSITPYHVWASRRYVPIVIPGLIVGAAFALAALARRSRLGWGGALVLAAVAVAFPAATLAPSWSSTARRNASCTRWPRCATPSPGRRRK